jgi:hypothetical protein
MKLKETSIQEIKEILQFMWIPVQVPQSKWPIWMRSIPEYIINSVYASGCLSLPLEFNYKSDQVYSVALVGGFDIYRNSPDDPVELNKDWYALLQHSDYQCVILVDGPFKDEEHWLNEVPNRLKNAPILD